MAIRAEYGKLGEIGYSLPFRQSHNMVDFAEIGSQMRIPLMKVKPAYFASQLASRFKYGLLLPRGESPIPIPSKMPLEKWPSLRGVVVGI